MSQEIKTQKENNDALVSENHELKSKVKMIELDNTGLKTKLDDITRNVSNFNKGRENLSKIIETSQSVSNKKGQGYTKKSVAPPKIKQNERNISKPKSTIVQPKRDQNSKTIKIWVPKTNNSLIRNKYIKSFLENVHKSQNYLYKGNTESSWVWFSKA